MILFLIGFFVGATVATTVIVLLGKKLYKQASSILNKKVRDIIINNKD